MDRNWRPFSLNLSNEKMYELSKGSESFRRYVEKGRPYPKEEADAPVQPAPQIVNRIVYHHVTESKETERVIAQLNFKIAQLEAQWKEHLDKKVPSQKRKQDYKGLSIEKPNDK